MRSTTITVILGLAANQVAVAAPIGCSSPCTREQRRVHYRSLTCAQYANDCYQNVRVLLIVKTFNVFTTVTRKHDNLNIANANSNKGLNGGANALEYAKQQEAEHSDDGSLSPYALMQPTQDVQYTTPVAEMQCVEDCPEKNVLYN
ncbi:hypothetical protein K493DRAFT_321802 [Basidiobolus meristosporus CBS 931.73]|uniref:CBM1 domain-containing protein n=1 Tax=Basidiobolus meristosporus CBS 931.73 TaxID=1314790 RepID=A0A1Y1W801_9FUNG|nr:hypothetical protein K493DRAFT_321802 [Basidiobolus meristosporus CBS 931.73]|eukprot:ORX69356.1 hypothetical protein K493DRAFT_321802 [Basidiobolus meristosporus CBS 931.73]